MNNLKKIVTIIISVIVPAIVIGQNSMSGKSNRSYMHHEQKDDNYNPGGTPDLGTLPGYKFESSLVFITQVNVDENGNNIIGDAANEPSIAIDPTDPNRMVIGWRQFDDVGNNFRQAGYGYTSDGGETWNFPGVIEPGVFRSDPVLDADSEGRFYYNSLTKDDVPTYWCNVYRTEPGGFTWDEGAFAQGGDKQWMVIDRSGGMGDGHIYSFWTSSYSYCYPGAFTRSIDGGNSYEDCVITDGDPYWGTMAVGPEGELYIAGSGSWDGIIVAKSTNAQNSANNVTWDSYTLVNMDGYLTGWTEINPAGLLGQANVCVDASGGPGNGNVYVLASVARNSGSDPADVMFSRSTDGGANWSEPQRINDDLGWSDYQWFGTMSVAPNGRIDVVWLDTRDDPSGNTLSALYYSYSLDEGLTWSANEKLSDIFHPHIGWPQQEKMGDYFDMESDVSSAHLAWASTLNGEQDIYYARITPQLTGTDKPIAKMDDLMISSYPNPFKDKTTIRYTLQSDSEVKILVTDVFGRRIKDLVNEHQTSGFHEISISAADLPVGISYCRIVAGSQTKTINLSRIDK